MERTNKDRAKNVEELFTSTSLYEDDETAITDLLADLMHYCDMWGESFDNHLYRARNHHREEVEEESAKNRNMWGLK